jgi:beta-lactamase regulating signal transducer with metallopeptidase domain
MTHYSELLALVLLHFVWQATVIALIYKFVDRRVAASRPDTRYNLALTALLCMFGSAVLTFFYERAHIGPASGARDVMASTFLNSSLPNSIHIAPLLIMIHEKANGIVQLIDIAWLAGVLVFFVRALGGAWMLSKIRTALSYAPGEELAQRFTDLARHLDLQHRVTLRVHAASISPFVAGTLRSIIYLPASALTSLSPDQIDAVLAHELAHVRRADYFWNLLQGAMETLFFFHPVVWWVGRIVREQRELCCDDIALQCSSTPISYAKALLVLAEGQYARPRFAMPLGGQHGRKHLLSRISRILGETCIPKEGTTPAAALRLTISGTIAAIVLCCSIAITPIKPIHALQAVFQKQFEEHPFSRSSAPPNSPRVRQGKQSSRITDDGRDGAGVLLPQNKQSPQEDRGVQTNQNARLAQLPQEPQLARLGHSGVGAENLSDSSEPHPAPHPNGESPHPHPGPPSPQPHPSNQH